MDALTHEQKLKLTVHHKARAICSETGDSLGIKFNNEALDLIGEVAWTVTRNFAQDLELFARHGKRSTVNADDVKLLVRKNPAMVKTVIQMANAQAAAKPKPATKRKSNNIEDVTAEPAIEEPTPGPSWLPDDTEDFIELN